jgi:hypothetical protein
VVQITSCLPSVRDLGLLLFDRRVGTLMQLQSLYIVEGRLSITCRTADCHSVEELEF